MKKNIGTINRLIRAGLGVLLAIIAIYWKSWILGIIAAFVFFEAIASWCVLYQIIGKNTCPIKKNFKM